MNKNRQNRVYLSSFMFVAVLAGLFFFWNQSQVHLQESTGTDLKVGVVNLSEVFKKYKRSKEFKQKITEQKEKVENKMNQIGKEVKQIDQELKELKPHTDLWTERANKYYKLRSELKFRRKTWKDRVNQRVKDTTLEIYNEVRSEVNDFADQNDFDLILKVESPDIPNEEQQANVNDIINRRPVLFFENRLDVTDQVVKRLNKSYNKGN